MDESNLMMALLIPGPTCPGKDFDLFLEPLVEDLIKLWKGVSTYDAVSGKKSISGLQFYGVFMTILL